MMSRSRNKVHDYVVVLSNPNLALIEKTGWLLSSLAAAIIIINLFITPNSWLLYLCLAITLFFGISNYIDKRKNKAIKFKPLLITAGIGLVMLTDSGPANVLFLIIGLIEGFFLHKTEIGFSQNEIVILRLWKERVAWQDLNNVIIKDGMLTIDFKNNRLVQAPTDDEEDDEYDVDDDEFNAFCREQLKAAHS